MVDVAKVLRRRMGAPASKVPTWALTSWLVRLAALRDPAAPAVEERCAGANAKDRQEPPLLRQRISAVVARRGLLAENRKFGGIWRARRDANS
jgi:hypothetical protein